VCVKGSGAGVPVFIMNLHVCIAAAH
jgi:hypothetical protein